MKNITTSQEIRELPVGTVIRDVNSAVLARQDIRHVWYVDHTDSVYTSDELLGLSRVWRIVKWN